LERGLRCEHDVDLYLFQKVEEDDLALEACLLIKSQW